MSGTTAQLVECWVCGHRGPGTPYTWPAGSGWQIEAHTSATTGFPCHGAERYICHKAVDPDTPPPVNYCRTCRHPITPETIDHHRRWCG